MKRLLPSLLLILIAALVSCHHADTWENNPEDNFDALWTTLDRHYCFFEQKGIDWDSIYREYRPRVTPKTSAIDLYKICAEMLNELRDGHVNLVGWYDVSYYDKWWSDYPQNYDERLVREHYLHFNDYRRNGLSYYMVGDSIGYLRYGSFSVAPGEGALNWALAILRKCHGLIIDIRDNGGGNISYVETIVSRFIRERTLAGYISHKNGTGHNDFSEPYPFYYDPAPTGSTMWYKPIVVLTNRSTFSAANNFVAVMSKLPHVTLIGDRTGGGSGMPFSSEMPIGWSVRFSSSPMYDADMHLTEEGIDPDIHIDLDPEQALKGIDTMLDKAIEYLEEKYNASQHANEQHAN